MPPALRLTPEFFQMSVNAAVVLAGLPLLVSVIARLIERRGVGLPDDRAWPDVCWARQVGGYQFVVVAVILHVGFSFALVQLPASALGLANLAKVDEPLANIYGAVLAIGHWAVTCGLILAYVFFVARGHPAAVGLTRRRLGSAAWTGLKTLLATMAVVVIALYVTQLVYQMVVHEPPAAHPVLESVKQSIPAWQAASFFALAGLLIPLFEELFWRGIVLTAMLRSGSAALAIIVSSLLFAATHIGVPDSVPAIFFLGLGLGYAYYRTRSLWASVVMHAVFNLYNMTLLKVSPPLVDWLREHCAWFH